MSSLSLSRETKNLADAKFVYAYVGDKDGDGSITKVEMKNAFEYGKRNCLVVRKIHEDMTSDMGCFGKDKLNKDEFRECLDTLSY
jgi:hypothetical protein